MSLSNHQSGAALGGRMPAKGGHLAQTLFLAAFAVLLLGWVPVMLYEVFDAGGANSAGLDILSWGSVILSLMLAVASGTVFLLHSWRQSRD